VRIVFLRDCDVEQVINIAFEDKCLPDNKSINDLVAEGKVKVSVSDLKQRTSNERIGRQVGSCDRLRLLVQMLDGAITADGTGEKIKLENLEFDPTYTLKVKADLKDFIIDVNHKGVFKLSEKRWIILQDA